MHIDANALYRSIIYALRTIKNMFVLFVSLMES